MSLNDRITAGIALLEAKGEVTAESKTSLATLIKDLKEDHKERVTKHKDQEKELTKVKDELRTLQLRNKVIDCTSPVKITEFMSNKDGTFVENRTALSDQVRMALQQSHIPGNPKPVLREPTVSEELDYWRNAGPVEDHNGRHHDMKALTIIPEFYGGSETQWRAFEHPWIMAIRNRNITETDMKTVLYPKLKGAAATLYLSIPGVDNMPFGEIMNRMRKEYISDQLTAFNRINAMSQKHNEAVRDFANRMILEGAGSMPRSPRELAVLVADKVSYVIPNPSKKEEEEVFPQRYEEAQSRLANAFLRGLRPEITARMTSERYTSFEQVVEAARKAEWMKDSISTGMIHTLEAEVNAMNVKDRSGGRFKPRGKGQQGQQSNDACFRCGRSGHWAAECRQPNKAFATSEQAHVQRARPTQQYYNPPRGKFSRGRGGFRGNGSRAGQGGREPLPWNPRDPRRRKWMVQKRAGLNRKMKYRHKVHNLTGQEIEDSYTTDEYELAQLEEVLEKSDPQDYEQYQLEVEEFQDAVDQCEDEPKN
jgi:Zinc knuckle